MASIWLSLNVKEFEKNKAKYLKDWEHEFGDDGEEEYLIRFDNVAAETEVMDDGDVGIIEEKNGVYVSLTAPLTVENQCDVAKNLLSKVDRIREVIASVRKL